MEPRLLDLVRAEALRRRTAVAASAAGPSRGGTPERAAVTTALEKAPALGRRAVELAYFGGLSVAEIAVILDSSVPELRQAMRETMLSVASATGGAGGKR
jgi:DNA-directed RNA polymerase specialized sigma24 family protein